MKIKIFNRRFVLRTKSPDFERSMVINMADRFKPSNHIDKKCFKAALYGRLSDEDRGKVDRFMESESIKNQRQYLHFAVDCLNRGVDTENVVPVEICGEYFDDDFTGITFDRPQFQKMMGEVERGNIDCIIVKDFSRFGRDYNRITQYLEKDFEKKGQKIRFAAYSDNYDSLRDRPDIGVRILLFLNEEYSRNQSHKVTTGMKSKMHAGEFIGAFTSYGYLKDPENKNHLIVDDAVRGIVKDIFHMNLYEGLGVTAIAKRLNERRIDSPSEYKRKNGSQYKCGNKIPTTTYWTPDTVNRILADEKYTGMMVQHKKRTVNFKAKEMESVSPDEWIKVPDKHEAIISREMFNAVRQLHRDISKNKNKNSNTSMFAGILKCGDCGHALIKNTEKYKDSVYSSHLCRTHKREFARCYSNRIYDNFLCKIILSDLNRIIFTVQNLEKIVNSCRNKDSEMNRKREINNAIRSKESEIKRYEDLLAGAEEKWFLGKINDEKYEQIKMKYQEDIWEMKNDIQILQESLKSTEDVLSNPWISMLLQKGKVEVLDRETIVEMIDSILIYHDNRLEINYKFSKELEVLFTVQEEEVS